MATAEILSKAREEARTVLTEIEAKQILAEARIQIEAAEQKLHAIGFSQEYLEKLAFHSSEPLTRFEIISPFDGVVTVSYTHLTLPTIILPCRCRWSPYH